MYIQSKPVRDDLRLIRFRRETFIAAVSVICSLSFIQSPLAAQTDTVLSVSRFGAKCDGNTDDAAAFQAAHDMAQKGGAIQIPAGVCVLGHNIDITRDNIKFRGSGQGSTYLKMGPGVTKLFNISGKGSVQLVLPEFSDFAVDGTLAPHATAFYVRSARAIYIERVYTVKCYISYMIDQDASHTAHTFHLSSFMIEDTPDTPGATGILLNGGGDDWFISEGRLFQNAQGRANTGMELRSGGGFILDRIDISQYGRAFVVDPPRGTFVRFGEISALQCDTSWGDNAVLDGVAAFASGYPNGIYDIHFVNCWFSSAGVHGGDGNGLNIIAAKGIVVDTAQIYSNSLNGVRIQAGARTVTISHSQLSANSDGFGNRETNVGKYSGIAVDRGTRNFTLDGNTSGAIGYKANTQKFGAFIDANCGLYRVIGNDFTNNITAPYQDLSMDTTAERQVVANLPAASNVISGSLSATGTVSASGFLSNGLRYKDLGTPRNGAFVYCPDCSPTPVCSGAGHGAFAKGINGTWVCN
jgi:hypothetical protein